MAIDWTAPIKTKTGWPARVICSDIKFRRQYAVAICNPELGIEWVELYDDTGISEFPFDQQNNLENQGESLSSMTFPGLGLDASASLLRHAFTEAETRRLNEKAFRMRNGSFGLRERESDLSWRGRNLETLTTAFGLRGVYLEAHAALIATADLNQDNAAACMNAIAALRSERKALRDKDLTNDR